MARKDFNTIIESLWWVAQGGVKAAICKVSSKSFNVSQLSHSDMYHFHLILMFLNISILKVWIMICTVNVIELTLVLNKNFPGLLESSEATDK